MNGGSQVAGRWQGEGDAEVVELSTDPEEAADFDAIETPRDRRPLVVAVLAWLCAVGWLIAVAWMHARDLTAAPDLPTVLALLRDASGPLILIVVIYLVAVRTSRSEAARLVRISGDLRGEQARLEAVLASVANSIDREREDIKTQADRLMTIGEESAERLRAVGDKLKADMAILARDAELLHQSTGGARGNLDAMIGDLPRIQTQTVQLTGSIEATGMVAYERAGALDAQIAALVARGREADEVAGGAAQKLAAHLARVEGVSDAAGARLVTASEVMTAAIDGALGRAAEAGDAARAGMEAQGAAMRALVEQSEAAIARTGADATEALARRVDEVRTKLEALGAMLAEHEVSSTKLIYGVASGIDRIDERFATIDEGAEARDARLSTALGSLATHADSLANALDRGATSADGMIGKTETLMTALDATVREIDESLPAAFARLDVATDASRAKVAGFAPEVARIEREASAALDRLIAAEALLSDQQAKIDALGATLDARLATSRAAANDLVAAVEGADARATAIAEGAGATLVEAMVRVRETAQSAAERAREALAAVVPESAERLSAAVASALSAAVTTHVEAQIGALAGNAERAVGAAHAASDRLMRQMLTIAETSAQVEARIAEARVEIDEADTDNFARRVALLIESLNSTAIDVTKILSNDITDSAWSAYLKGDRGVFTRRAIRLLDAGEAREILRHYNAETEFRDQVNRYVHDFEAMLRNVLATRSGSPLGVTLLSSDMGKLYVALAQAIQRLRS